MKHIAYRLLDLRAQLKAIGHDDMVAVIEEAHAALLEYGNRAYTADFLIERWEKSLNGIADRAAGDAKKSCMDDLAGIKIRLTKLENWKKSF